MIPFLFPPAALVAEFFGALGAASLTLVFFPRPQGLLTDC